MRLFIVCFAIFFLITFGFTKGRKNETRNRLSRKIPDVIYTNTTRYIMQEILPSINLKDDPIKAHLTTEEAANILKEGLQIFGKTTNFLPCTKCGPASIGEIRRRVDCFVRQIDGAHRNESVRFNEVPCNHTLVPRELRIKLEHIPVYEQFSKCSAVPCPPSSSETRQLLAENIRGIMEIVDVLPPGTYGLKEKVPNLKKIRKVRKLHIVKEGERLELTCPVRFRPITWHYASHLSIDDLKAINATGDELNSTVLLHRDSERQRIVLSSTGTLIITSALSGDEGEYECYQGPEPDETVLLRIHSVYILTSTAAARISSLVSNEMVVDIFIHVIVLFAAIIVLSKDCLVDMAYIWLMRL